jgi:2-dehydro-3-deoxyphosphogluconate aldolase/(4S)-4-hydroxy-2-oxoglutarate aldolase
VPRGPGRVRTSAAEEAIRRMASELPEIVIGAGTVLSVEQAEKATAAGARYIVSSGFDPKVVVRQRILAKPGFRWDNRAPAIWTKGRFSL